MHPLLTHSSRLALRGAARGLWALWFVPFLGLAQPPTPRDMAANNPSAGSSPTAAPGAARPAAATAATSLAAAATPQGVVLTWTAPAAKTPLRFEVERSSDGVTFRSVGVVLAAEAAGYRFLDAGAGATTVYYRLRQPVAGGSGTSAVLTYTPDTNAWQPSPNPATDWLSCGPASGDYRIMDAAGRTVLTGRLVAGQRIDVRRLRNGNHTLEMRMGNLRATRTFLKYAPAE
ncbi:T9SS type A sorting domain-containing protein [Hymenobacter jeollabukensis]|uniref:T9SS type A sorting domain-containing protein n=1 Tax=Hymenobacter jeollabukensis TaxID=2025313 RepID=A0A5R8WM15_9BACT|nr:T9SS type A sorting domain-containing protein [Hymenobacter jeollabukensis]TLM89857.1 T9SS type A sorting domain-containing protein [Hymenobacter jeollabukensis]